MLGDWPRDYLSDFETGFPDRVSIDGFQVVFDFPRARAGNFTTDGSEGRITHQNVQVIVFSNLANFKDIRH